MPHPENIIPPKKGEIRNPKGKPVGTKNRATILKKWIELNTKLKNPITGKDELGTVEDKVKLALISKALSGDVAAIKEIDDTLYGKIADKGELKVDEKINILFSLKKNEP
jgi:hypothetical protein